MPDFDVPQVREAAARAEFRRVYGSVVSWERARGPLQEAYLQGAAAAMSVIVPAVTQQVRALHRPVHLTFSWKDGVRAEEPCEVCGGKAGERECGCWGDVDRYVYCLACSDLSGHTSHHTDYPCQTVLLLDEIDAAVRGEE
ncbi:MAG: hypothetical protein KDB60_12635 [Propionibacteriaceae bacterium]|nr:hypothetical protein [Propionibacteriaceae bacterium]